MQHPPTLAAQRPSEEHPLPSITRARYLRVEFGMELSPPDIPLFRGAMGERMGHAEHLFHNHDADGAEIYRYPLIQYKSIRGKAAIVALNEGADAMQRYFSQPERRLTVDGKTHEMTVDDLRMNQVVLRTWNQQFHYRIQNWLALQDEPYKEYLATNSLARRATILEKRLTNTILTMARGLDWWVAEPIEVSIAQYWEGRSIRHKDVRFLAFNAEFSTNVFLPDYIGLGKGVAFGFGVVKSIQAQDHGK
ncbi:MAG: CRISPR-associated endonuclease Cas6 [Bacteroidia bacterium]